MSEKGRKFCINCGQNIPAEAAYCPFCSAWQLDVLPKPSPELSNKKGKDGPELVKTDGMEQTYKLNQVSDKKIIPRELKESYKTDRPVEKDTKSKEELLKKAYTDSVTGVYSKERLDDLVKNLSPDDIVTITVLNVTNYNMVVNAYSREYGNELLRQSADIICSVCPKETYRIEGGEFVIVMFNRSLVDTQRHITDIIDLFRENSAGKRSSSQGASEFIPEIAVGITELKHGEQFSLGLQRAEAEAVEDLKGSTCKQKYADVQSVEETCKKTPIRGNAYHTSKDEYRSQKRSYGNVLSGKIAETVILALVLAAVIFAKGYFKC